ncbi:hypothetical protein [Inquilinus sp. OTU3971]|uniref:hypothetical protein n=1 Tax=Inquilinus sp. OTU3971 TaxID=3043855 RepID=UPI00313EAFCD
MSIREYIELVSNYIDFISFCVGAKLTPQDIHIDRLSRAEEVAAVERQTYRGDYSVFYVWPEAEIDARDLWVGGSPVRAWDEEELSGLRACLLAWMGRVNVWKKSYAMMTGSFALRNTVSTERLINACRWFEEIPIASAQSALSDAHMDAIANAATECAEKLGHPSAIRERITGAISRIKAESAEAHFTRLVTMIEKAFGKSILPQNAVLHLRRAIHLRGKSAHKHFDPKSDEEFRAFTKSILAMEAVCYLLTALDLPMLEMGKERMRHNALVKDYSLAYE